MSNETKYPKGAFYNKPHEKAPSFVLGELNITDKKAFITWLNGIEGNTVKLQFKDGKEGKGYAELDTWKANDVKPPANNNVANTIPDNFDDMEDSLPF
jgi:hypothetical protein